jgi:NitT/TauT family transport system ATP-binding protein
MMVQAGTQPFLRLSGVSKEFSTRERSITKALEDITFDIAAGELLTIVGPSGSGKSTLLRVIAGLLPPTAGKLTLRGKVVDRPSSEFGVVFQAPVLFPWRTVLSNVLMPARILRLDLAQAMQRAMELLETLGLRGTERKYPYELSGGMQQRVSIARALIHDPASLLMDEPFGALDAMTRESLNLELLRLWHTSRKTIIFITHSIPEAVFLGTRVLVLTARPGRIAGVVSIDLPHPRTIELLASDRLGAYAARVRSVMEGRHPGAAFSENHIRAS